MASVAVHAIRKSFGSTEVLRGVSLDVTDRSFMTLVGPSGCGKSTLLRIIAGLEVQDAGEVRIDGTRVDDRRPADRDLAMVFQSYALYPHLSVRRNMAVPLEMRRLNMLRRLPLLGRLLPGSAAIRRGIEHDVRRVADILRIEPLLNRKPAQLSGGQRQRVALGRAMVRDPKAFLMDEPLSNLDAKLREHMRTEIAQLQDELGATFVYVTHDQAEAMTMSDRIAVMMDGEILQVAEPAELYANPVDLRVAGFIGSPRINIVPGVVTDAGLAAVGQAVLDIRPAAPAGSELQIAFRPEAADPAPASPCLPNGRVTLLEHLGADVLIHVTLDVGAHVILRAAPLSAGLPRRNDRIGIRIPLHALLFDAAGRRRDVLATMRPEQPVHA